MSIILKDVKVEWVSVSNPTKKYGETTDREYTISALLTKEQAQEFVDAGIGKAITPHKELKDTYVRKFAVSEFTKEGKAMPIPKLVDSKGKTITDMVGNGSVASIQYRIYDWDNKFGKGKTPILQNVMITDLVAYGSSNGDLGEFGFLEDIDVDLSSDLEF